MMQNKNVLLTYLENIVRSYRFEYFAYNRWRQNSEVEI